MHMLIDPPVCGQFYIAVYLVLLQKSLAIAATHYVPRDELSFDLSMLTVGFDL